MKKRSKQPRTQLLHARRRLRDDFVKRQEKIASLLTQTEAQGRKIRQALAPALSPEERLKEEDGIREEQYWEEVADAFRAGNLKKIRKAIQTFGVWALTKSPVLTVLNDLEFDLIENNSAKRERA